jgi:undecaprenol kinase
MSMDSHAKKKPNSMLKSFSCAIVGIKTAIKAERNMRIHLISTVLVIGGSFYFSITRIEWLFILLTIGGMLALELINTAIERIVDLVTGEYHPLAKQAKDLAAGAVFLYAVLSVGIGFVIFLPYLLKLWK